MKPAYDVHCGDALHVLRTLARARERVDMVFLDIPYDAPGNRGGNRFNTSAGTLYRTISPEEFGAALSLIVPLLRTPRSCVVYMHSTSASSSRTNAAYIAEIRARLRCVARGEYVKLSGKGTRLTQPMRSDPLPPEAVELYTVSGRGPRADSRDLQFDLARPRGYKTEKPAAMLARLIELTTKPGDVVLDPFAGSGVTGEQAVRLGRRAVLVEIDGDAVRQHIEPRLAAAANEAPTTEKR